MNILILHCEHDKAGIRQLNGCFDNFGHIAMTVVHPQ
jgi:hypothetical protein